MAENKVRLIEQDAIDDVVRAKTKVDELVASVTKLVESTKGKSITFIDVDSSKKLEESLVKITSNLEKFKKGTESVKSALTEQEKAEARLAVAIEKRYYVSQDILKNLAENTGAVNRNNAEYRKADKIANALNSTYLKLEATYSKLNQKAQDAGAKFGAQSKEFKKASAAALKYRSRIDQIDKTLKNSQRNVGNYSSALAGTGRVFSQLIGALGVTGGIYAFVNLTKSIFETVKELNSINFAMKAVIKDATELAQTQSWLREITEAYGAELVTTSKRYTKFRAAAQEANLSAVETQKIFATVTKAAGVLGLKTDELTGVYLALEQMISKGKITTEELRRQLGERLPGAMDIMAKSMGVTTSELDKMMKKGEVITKDVLPAFAEQLEKSYGIENVTRVDTLVAAQTRLSNAWVTFIDDIEKGNGVISKFFTSFLDGAAKSLGMLTEISEASNGFFDFMGNLVTGIQEGGAAAIITQAAINREVKLRNTLSKELARLTVQNQKEQLEMNKGVSEEALIKQRVLEFSKLNSKELQERIEAIKEVNKQEEEGVNIETRRRAIVIDTATSGGNRDEIEKLKLQFEIMDAYEIRIELMKDMIELERDPTARQVLIDTKKSLEENLEIYKTGNQIQLDGHDAINESMKKYLQIKKVNEKVEEELDNQRIGRLEKTLALLQLMQGVLNAGADIAIGLSEKKIIKLEEEKDAIDETYDAAIKRAEDEAVSKEQLEVQKDLAKENRDIKQKELDEKIKKEKTKQAKVEKAANMFNIAMNTAAASISIWAQVPKFDYGVSAATLQAYTIALGAVQLAAVAAQPIPKFKEGKDKSNRYEGMALLNDGGRTEYREDKLGNIHEIMGRNTLGYVNREDIVHKDFDSMLDYHNIIENANRASIMASLDIDRGNLNKAQSMKVFQAQMSNEKFKSDVKDILRGWKFHNHMDSTQLANAVGKAISVNDFKNRLL